MFETVRHNLQHYVLNAQEPMDSAQRCSLADEMAYIFDHDSLNERERHLAEEIIADLINDEVESVRLAIAVAVGTSPHLPVELAHKLACDISAISLPILKLSPVLEDRFLEGILKTGVVEKMLAIAERHNVSAQVCRRIVSMGRKEPVLCLLANKGAEINDHTMITIVRVYGDDEKMEQAIFDRGELSDDVLATLRNLSEAHVSDFIQKYFKIPGHVMDVERGRDLLDGLNRKPAWWNSKQGPI
ncbi:MAG: DUF2336 domain-containing protein [Terasakiella sp.]|uniref:DUF2336 domain-containing protein n=1 Tax=unclassified Terasakiella TaxID=2614952 RepID=UPI003B00945F